MAEVTKGVDGEDYVQVEGRWFKAIPAEAVIGLPEPAPVEGGA